MFGIWWQQATFRLCGFGYLRLRFLLFLFIGETICISRAGYFVVVARGHDAHDRGGEKKYQNLSKHNCKYKRLQLRIYF